MLTIDNLVKSYSGQRSKRRSSGPGKTSSESVFAVSDVSFEVQQGELFTLLGPSGCGKTTTLRSVAGLERPDSGSISLEGRVLFDGASKVVVPSNKRGIGMVFQSYAIWPHMTVYKNVAFPLEVVGRGHRKSRAQIAEAVARALEATELTAYADRPATKLSGGQQQRLALARALVFEPPLILLDEPLSNLDAKLRENMRFELKRLQRDQGVTSIYVTHDQTEALALSSRIAVMSNGRIEQVGRPRDIYNRPASRFVAEFVGASNFVEGVVEEVADGRTLIRTDVGVLISRTPKQAAKGEAVLVSIRPESISVSTELPAQTQANALNGKLVSRAFIGDAVEYIIAVGIHEFRVRSSPSVRLGGAEELHLSIAESDVVVVPK